MTPYGRLALLAGGTAWAVGLVLVARYLGGWLNAGLVAAIAVVVALVATLEIASGSRPASEEALQTTSSVEGAKQELEDFAIRRRERAEIERSAALAREE